MSDHQDYNETTAAVDSILAMSGAISIFDPLDTTSTSTSHPLPSPSPLHFGATSGESSDEETREFILKHDPFVPVKASSSGTPRVNLRKTPRIRNAPKCTYKFKKGKRKGDICEAFCKLGEGFCGKHKSTEGKKPSDMDLEPFALEVRFRRLKISRKYELIQKDKRSVLLRDGKRILKVRLPNYLKPIPKTGSYLILQRTGKGELSKGIWKCV